MAGDMNHLRVVLHRPVQTESTAEMLEALAAIANRLDTAGVARPEVRLTEIGHAVTWEADIRYDVLAEKTTAILAEIYEAASTFRFEVFLLVVGQEDPRLVSAPF